MRTYVLGLLGKFGAWLARLVEAKIWRCFFCKKLFSVKKPRVSAFVLGNPIFQCEACRVRHEKDPTRRDTPPEGIY